MTAVTIPPEVLADVAAALAEGGARLAAYRPHVEPHAQVLNLDAGDVCEVVGPAAGGTLHVVRGGIASSYLDAWLAVGSVDGGPRPEVGGRVLVLDCEIGHAGQVALVVEASVGGYIRAQATAGVMCLAGRWALLPNPAPDAPSAPPPATATRNPARGGTPEASDAADDVSQNPLRKPLMTGRPGHTPGADRHPCPSCGTCVGCDACADPDNPHDEARGDCADCGACGPCIAQCANERGQEADDLEGDNVQVQHAGPGTWAQSTAGPLGPPSPIPPGRWRQGSHAPRNLWIGGAHPEGVDVGRMDTPELAELVVKAVNGYLRDGPARVLLARLRGWLEFERDRYNNARTGQRDDVSGDKADALDQVLDWLDDNGAPAGQTADRDVARREIDAARLNAAMADEARAEVRAEVERLRAALHDVADGPIVVTGQDGAAVLANRRRDIALKALAVTP